MHRIRAGAALGVTLAILAGATAANAVWGVRAPLPVSATATGDLAVTAAWTRGTPTLTAPFPTQSVTTGDNRLRVTVGGSGTTLRARVLATVAVASAFQPYVSTQVWAGACDAPGSAIVPAVGYSPPAGLAPGASIDLCVKFTLAANAPSTLMGQPLQPTLTVTLQQRGA